MNEFSSVFFMEKYYYKWKRKILVSTKIFIREYLLAYFFKILKLQNLQIFWQNSYIIWLIGQSNDEKWWANLEKKIMRNFH